MIKKTFILIITLALIIQFGCKKESKDALELIGEPEVLMMGPTTVKISWETNYPSISVVSYGLTSALGDTAMDKEERERHKVTLTDLIPDTVYYFDVASSSDNFEGTARSEIDQFLTQMNEASYTVLGWNYFAEENYSEAITAFSQAIDMNTNYGEAYIGSGWCNLRFGLVINALNDFDAGLALNDTLLVGYAGRAMARLDDEIEDNTGAKQDALVVLNADPNFVFKYDESINSRWVRLTLAQAYFALREYELAQEQCDILYPANGLDMVLPDSDGKWRFGGSVEDYDSYQEALLGLIQYLMVQEIGG